MTAVLFLCLGNICRSPTAEAVFRRLAAEAGLAVQAGSAGTGDWHAGEPPDPRAIAAGRTRGYDLTPLRARKIVAGDFRRFALILAMDGSNLAEAGRLAPPGATATLRLFLPGRDVPDPWYTGAFDATLALIEDGCRDLVAQLRPRGAA